jgi:hypothetical protein
MNPLRAFLSRLFPLGRRNRLVLSNQNGRSSVQVTDAQLLRARDDLIRRQHSGPRHADTATAIRANWPLERLTSECAEAWSNGKVLTVGARTGFSGWLIPGAREIDLPPDADDATNSQVVVAADSSAAAIGSALRLTFSRCLDTFGQKSKTHLIVPSPATTCYQKADSRH